MPLPTPTQPWLELYDAGVSQTLKPAHDSVVTAFREALRQHPAHPAIRYFDATMTMADLNEASDALARALEEGGFSHGDRLAVYLQNIAQFKIASLAVWKLSGFVVTVSI